MTTQAEDLQARPTWEILAETPEPGAPAPEGPNPESPEPPDPAEPGEESPPNPEGPGGDQLADGSLRVWQERTISLLSCAPPSKL
jgi:hypothetical protein